MSAAAWTGLTRLEALAIGLCARCRVRPRHGAKTACLECAESERLRSADSYAERRRTGARPSRLSQRDRWTGDHLVVTRWERASEMPCFTKGRS